MLRHIFNRALPLLLGLACLLGLFLFGPKTANATSPTTINFQGKVVNPSGTNVADNNSPGYTFVFRLYNTASPTIGATCTPGSGCLWEETDTVPVSNSIFQVELGGSCSFFSAVSCNNNTPIDFSSNSLYLTMNFNGDTSGSHGFMTPLIHFTGVPYAYQAGNSSSLGNIAAANYVQLATGNVQTDSTTNNSIAVNKTGGSGNILLLEANSKTALTVNNSGTVVLGQAGASGLAGTLTFQNATDSSTASISFTGNATASYTYLLPSTSVSSGQCLQSGTLSGNNVPLTFASCSTGGGYATIQDEGSNLTQRTTVNFIGNSVACVDNSGSSRTDCTVAPTLQNTYDNSGSPATIVSSSSSKNIIFESGSSSNSNGFFQIQNSSGSSGTLFNADTSNMRIGVNVTYSSMTVPSGLTSTASAGTGFTAGQSYLYEVTAIDSLGGETTVSNEPTACAPASSNLQCTLAWTAVTGASGYRVYRTANGTGTGTEKYLTTVLKNSYIDSNSITLSSTNPPGSNSAFTSTNTSNSLAQISVGGLGTSTGQVYVGGTLPKDVTNGGVATGTTPRSNVVQGRYDYVISAGSNKLQAFDVSNPSAPVDISSGGVSTINNPSNLKIQGHYAYVTSGSVSKLQVFDISNPSSIVDVSAGGATTAASVNGIYIQGRYAYLDVNLGSGFLQVFDVSNPSVPTETRRLVSADSAGGMFVQGHYLYLGDIINAKLRVYDISNPSSPSDVSSGGVALANSPQSVYVQGRYAYVIENTKLQIFDISNPAGAVDVTGGGVATAASARQIYIQGRYAYVIESSKLQIFDISNPNEPVDISGGGVSVAGNTTYMEVQGRYAYVTASTTSTLQIYDLGGEYTQQLEAGGTETGTLAVDSNSTLAGDVSIGGGVQIGQSLTVGDGFAVQNTSNSVLLSADSTSSRVGVNMTFTQMSAPSGLTSTASAGTGFTAGDTYRYEVTAIDSLGGETGISNEPSACAPASSNLQCTLSWTAVTGASGYKVYRTANGGASGSEKYITTVLKNSFIDSNANALSSTNSPSSNTAFTSTNTSNSLAQISVGGLGSPTGQVYIGGILPKDITSGGWGNTNGTPTAISVQGRYAYIANAGGNGIYDVSNPASPVLIHSLGSCSIQHSIFVQGHYFYFTCSNTSKFSIWDISNPSSPTDLTNGGVTLATAGGIAYVQGRYAYLLAGSKLVIYDVSNPTNPVDVSNGGLALTGGGNKVFVQGRYAYVVESSSAKLQVIDISNPASPTDISSGGVSTGAGANNIYVQGRYAYVLDSTASKLQIFDVSNPASPSDVSNSGASTAATPQQFSVQGRYAYVVEGSLLQVFDVSNPASPTDVSGGGVATTANGNNIAVQGRYAYVVITNTPGRLQVFDLGGEYAQQLEAGGTETGTLTVDGNTTLAGDATIGGGVQIGQSLSVGDGFSVQNTSNGQILSADGTTSRVGVNMSFKQMSTPSGLTSTASAGTGFTAGQSYLYEVTAIDSLGGETTVSNEPTACAPASSNLQCTLAWTAVTGASGYRVYRTANAGASGSETYLTTVLKNSYIDTNSITLSSTSQPTSNSAYTSTNNSNSLAQISVGGLGTPTGQVYVGGIIPKFIGKNSDSSLSSPQGVYVQGHYAYVVNFSGNKLAIYDVSNPAAPTFVAVNSDSNLNSPTAVSVVGRYAYVASTSNNKLAVCDVSNPTSFSCVVNSDSNLNQPHSVYVQGRYAYLASSSNNKLAIYDISNPSSPTFVAVNSDSNLNSPQTVFVQGRYAYIVSLSNNKLAIYDVSNPAAPTFVAVNSDSNLSSPRSVSVVGRYAYVATSSKLDVYDISNPSSPTFVAANSDSNVTTGLSLMVQGRYAFVASNGAGRLDVYDISNPSSPTFVAANSDSIMGAPNYGYVQGRYAYVTDSNNKLLTYDLGGEYTQQLEAGSTETGTLSVDGNSSFAGDASISGGLQVGQSIQVSGNIGGSGGLYIQGGNILGGGKNQLGAPTGLTSTATAGTGFTAGQSYRYEVTAVDSNGNETTVSNEPTACSPASTNLQCTLAWTAVTGASSYNVYRTANSGGSGTELNLTSVTTNSYIDANTLTLGAEAPPGTDTTGQFTDLGSALFKNNTNSTTAFQIQNSGALSLLTVNTTSSLVLVGSSTSHASNPVVLVLDNYNNASDPTGGQATNGAMYYNSSTNKFRCYQNGGWTNCISSTTLSSYTILTSTTANSTYTVPSGVTTIMVEILGGGGAGGGTTGAANSFGSGAGGGAGGYARKIITGLAASYKYTIGTGGTGAAGAGGNGGGQTCFGTNATACTTPIFSCNGGSGGTVSAAGTTAAQVSGAAGGSCTSGDLNITGATGIVGVHWSGTVGLSGAGAATMFGNGGGGQGVAGTGLAAPTNAYGAGGGGAVTTTNTNGTGGAGQQGVIIIWEFK